LALQVSDVERSNAYYRWKLAQALRLKNTRCHCAVIIIIIIIIHLI
jgi:t-SNARE complex subunit (syntaxin)